MWYVWLILAGIFMIGEIITNGFLIFWLGLGALLAMLVSFITDSLVIQIAVFVGSSTLFILFTKPLLQKFMKKDKTVDTNAFTIVGKKAIEVKDINTTLWTRQIKVECQLWSAKPETEETIEKGTEVLILSIDGVKAVVTTNLQAKVPEEIFEEHK